jgi:hypothetical protein
MIIRLFPEGDGSGDVGDQDQKDVEKDQKDKDKRDKVFNQEQVDKLIQDRVKKLDRENKEHAKKSVELQAKLDQLMEKLAQLEKKPDPPADDVQGHLNLLNEKHKRELDGLTGKIDELSKKLTVSEEKRLETQRDKELDAALIKAGCNDLKGGRRQMLPQLSYDAVDEKWLFNLEKTGGTVSIDEGVEEELPDYLRKPKAERGGSGSTTSDRARKQKSNELEAGEKQLQAMKDKIAATGGKPQDLLTYQQQKRRVEALKKELQPK